MKTCCSVAALVMVQSLCAIDSRMAVATRLPNGDLSVSFVGFPGHQYALESAGSLIPPLTWTPLVTNTADSSGLVSFTETPAGSQAFYRVHDATPIPLVYAAENTGANYPPPPLPTRGDLPYIEPLPDPFDWASDPLDLGGTRSTDFFDWEHRRNEILAQILYYEIGPKPIDASVAAAYAEGTLTVTVTRTNGRALTLTCQVAVPSSPPLANGLYPAIIGMALVPGGGTGSLPSDIFSNCLQITYLHDQVTVYDLAGNMSNHTNDPYFLMYPEYNYAGQYSAWAWGVSRVIDGLYQVAGTNVGQLNIDLKRIAVTGCSYAGKMALFAGALDERVALTIPQESGGGGGNSWRYNHFVEGDSVEDINNTSYEWFRQDQFLRQQFGGDNVAYLPEDHHLLCAMCLPRALFTTANTDYTWLGNPSHYVNGMATKVIYDTFGIGDRYGFDVDGGHSHCTFPNDQRGELQYFVSKFLLGQTSTNEYVTTRPALYNAIDYARWTAWWGTTNPVFPPPSSNDVTMTFEAECANVGTNWLILTDTNASNGRYVTPNSGLPGTTNSPPADSSGWVVFPFSVTNSGNYAVFGRCNNPNNFAWSYWVQMDNGGWVKFAPGTSGAWQWLSFKSYALTAGAHTFYVGYRQPGAKLDKLSISTYPFAPQGLGQPAGNLCGP